MTDSTRRAAFALCLALGVGPMLACGFSGAGSEAAPAAPAPAAPALAAPFDDSLLRELCGGFTTRAPTTLGHRRDAWDEYRELDPAASRARTCDAGRSLLDAGAGLYRLGLLAAQAGDDDTFVRDIRYAGLEIVDPISLGKLGQIEFHGLQPDAEHPDRPVVEADLGAAYVHIQAAMQIADRIRRLTGDNRLQTLVVSGTLAVLDSYETPEIRARYDVMEHRAEIARGVAELIARFEDRHSIVLRSPGAAR